MLNYATFGFVIQINRYNIARENITIDTNIMHEYEHQCVTMPEIVKLITINIDVVISSQFAYPFYLNNWMTSLMRIIPTYCASYYV